MLVFFKRFNTQVVRRWRAMCKLLDNEEAGRGGGGAGALDGREQTVVARVMLTSAKVTEDATLDWLWNFQFRSQFRGFTPDLTQGFVFPRMLYNSFSP